jgi:hypothetical protein
MDAFVIHQQPFSLEQNVQPSVSKPCTLRRVRMKASQHGEIQRTASSLIKKKPRRAGLSRSSGAGQSTLTPFSLK